MLMKVYCLCSSNNTTWLWHKSSATLFQIMQKTSSNYILFHVVHRSWYVVLVTICFARKQQPEPWQDNSQGHKWVFNAARKSKSWSCTPYKYSMTNDLFFFQRNWTKCLNFDIDQWTSVKRLRLDDLCQMDHQNEVKVR